ncbi:hypothetical protein ABTZ93_39240 [Streptomyces sp. NPDC097941]|uniref:hypothetical protein n=1 Tax=Streptomyces sp. NPDC097941 TaxID=3155685 RepID=UPI00331EA4A1
MIGLLLLACSLPLVNGAMTFGSMYGLLWSWSPRGRYIYVWAGFSVAAIVFLWLSWLVIARTTLDRVTPRQRLLQRGAAVLSGAAAMYATGPFPSALTHFLGQAVFTCVLAWLALEVWRAHGIPWGISLPRTAVDRLRDWDITQLVFTACLAGGGLSLLMGRLIRWTGVDAPVMKDSQMSALGIDSVGALFLAVVATVAFEDVVLVAATTALLTAVRRPAWQIYTLVCVLEVLLHAYLGLPAIGMLLFAAGRVWLYGRYGRLVPLMATHLVFDLVNGSLQLLLWVPFLYRFLAALLVVIAAYWVGHRLRRAAHPAGGESLPQPAIPDGDVPQLPDRRDTVSIQ